MANFFLRGTCEECGDERGLDAELNDCVESLTLDGHDVYLCSACRAEFLIAMGEDPNEDILHG